MDVPQSFPATADKKWRPMTRNMSDESLHRTINIVRRQTGYIGYLKTGLNILLGAIRLGASMLAARFDILRR